MSLYSIACAMANFFLAIIAFLFFNLGMDWLNFGYGLHPLIAFPVAALALAAIIIFTFWTTEDTDDPLQYIDMSNK